MYACIKKFKKYNQNLHSDIIFRLETVDKLKTSLCSSVIPTLLLVHVSINCNILKRNYAC